jgi:type II secretory pathway pseudopilin PulG
MTKLLREFNKPGNPGFTLIEVLVILAITGAIAGVLSLTINQTMQTSSTETSQSLLLTQVHQAAAWITRDIGSAKGTIVTENGTVLCSLKRYKWNGTDDIPATTTVDYIVYNGVLLRKENGGPGMPVAQFISYPDLNTTLGPSGESNTYILKLKAVNSDSSFQQQYKIRQRLP